MLLMKVVALLAGSVVGQNVTKSIIIQSIKKVQNFWTFFISDFNAPFYTSKISFSLSSWRVFSFSILLSVIF